MGSWIPMVVALSGADIFTVPNADSEKIGHFDAGRILSVYPEQKNGFFTVHFSTPWNGLNYAYVPVSSVESPNVSNSSLDFLYRSEAAYSGARTPNTGFWISIGANLSSLNPSEMQTTLLTNKSSFFGLGYQAEMGFTPREYFGWGIMLNHYNFTKDLGTSGTSSNFFANGYAFILSLYYPVFTYNGFKFILGGGGGVAVNTAGNNIGSVQASGSNLLSYPVRLELRVRQDVWDNIGITGDFGYQFNVLSNVDTVLPPSGALRASTSLNISGILIALSAHYWF